MMAPWSLTTGITTPSFRKRFGISFLKNPAISNPSSRFGVAIHVCSGTANAMGAFRKDPECRRMTVVAISCCE
jgi:hypothetical protein